MKHGALLGLVAARVNRQNHGVAMAGEMASPALKTGRAIPQTMGNDHQATIASAGRLQHHQPQRRRAMGHGQTLLKAADSGGARLAELGIR